MNLPEIMALVAAENERSRAKFGPWQELPVPEQVAAIFEEYREWETAWLVDDIKGPHGEIAEGIQVINVFIRRIMYLTGEANA